MIIVPSFAQSAKADQVSVGRWNISESKQLTIILWFSKYFFLTYRKASVPKGAQQSSPSRRCGARANNDKCFRSTQRSTIRQSNMRGWLALRMSGKSPWVRNIWKKKLVERSHHDFLTFLLLLELQDGIAFQVAHVNFLSLLQNFRVLLAHQPSHVGEEKTSSRVVRISIRVRELVMNSMVPGPLQDWLLPSHCL